MSTKQVKCPNPGCDQMLMLSAAMAGRKAQCPKCGKTFQIPKTFAKPAGSSSPVPRKRPASPQRSAAGAPADAEATMQDVPVVEVVGEVVGEVVDYEADDFEAGYEAAPRRSRSRARDLDYDDDDDEDDDDDFGAGRSKHGLTKTRKRQLLSVGCLIVAIGTCVFSGSLVLSILAELFGEIGMASTRGTGSLQRVAANFLKISQVFIFVASIGLVTGYAFCLFTPNKHGSLGLMIATLSVGAVNMVLRVVFRMIPAFTNDLLYDRALFAVAGRAFDAGQGIMLIFMELMFCAEVMLLSLFLAAVARIQKDRVQRGDCMRTVWFMTGVASVVFLMSIFLMIEFNERWPVYVIRIMSWAANGVLAIAFVFHVMNLFHAFRSTKPQV